MILRSSKGKERSLIKVSNGCFPIELDFFFFFCNFVCIVSGLVLLVCGSSLNFDDLPLFKNTLSFDIHNTRKLRYRASRAHFSNPPTEVSFH